MGKVRAPLYGLNRGEVSKEALGRIDVDRLRLSAETQENFTPFVVGPMMLRPGFQKVGATKSNAVGRNLRFTKSMSDLAFVSLIANYARFYTVADDVETLVTRAAVSTVVTNGDFSLGTGWTLTATGTGAVATISGDILTLKSPATGGLARCKRSVTVAGGDTAIVHAFRVVVTRGPVTFRCGTTDGADDVFNETTLDTGIHSLAFIPGATTVYIQLETISAQAKIVDSITIEAAGTLELPTPWGANDLQRIRYDQSGDIIFCACAGFQQRKIERRSTTSWSIVLYQSSDGPYKIGNVTDITLTPSALSGNGTLTASRALFRSTHVGALLRLFSNGQNVTNSILVQNTFTDPIRVTGVGLARRFTYAITGTWVGTLTLEVSFDGPTSGFIDSTAVSAKTNNATGSVADGLDNSIAWYRWGFKTGDYTSGTADITLNFPGGGGRGICRITAFTSSTVVDIEILDAFSSITGTTDWNFGMWSDRDGWPTALAFADGRLEQSGYGKFLASETDAYYSYGIDTEGESAAINRAMPGAVDTTNWLLPLSRTLVGREGVITSIRASALDEFLTPTNYTAKDCATQGAFALDALKIDTRGVFVQQSNRKVYELFFNPEIPDYDTRDLTRLNLDIGLTGFVASAVCRQPDTSIFLPREDGQMAAFLYDIKDEAEAWYRFISDGADGLIEDVMVLPGSLEDRVYIIIKRTVNGGTVRYIEKMARRDQCTGLPEARLVDSHVNYSNLVSTTLTGLDHLEGEDVVVWVWDDNDEVGQDFQNADGTTKTYTVASGSITIDELFDNACVGLAYRARFKSAKLAYAAQMGTALFQKKKTEKVGMFLINTHSNGIKFGQSFDVMDQLPRDYQGEILTEDTVFEEFDEALIEIPGEWTSDARICLEANSPRPCTVGAIAIGIQTNEQ
jgi:hypothetical protein